MMRVAHLRLLRRMDWIMALTTILLLVIGIAFIYSAGSTGHDQPSSVFYRRQFLWAALGLACFLGFAMLDYHTLVKLSWWFYVAGIILLVLVLMPQFGQRVYGARRWIQLAGFRILQPSEPMKLALIILLARLFGWPDRDAGSRPLVILALVLTVLPVILIIRQPDLGTALIFVPVLGSVMLVAGTPFRILGGFILTGVALCCILFGLIILPQKIGWSEERQVKTLETLGITPYQRDRLLVFIDSERDPLGAGWSRAQSRIAVGSGRFWGKGYLKGTQNILGFLPRTVAPNDFVFSVIAEEKGFAGGSMVLFLFVVMLGCIIRAAAAARDRTGMILCVGIAAMLFCHVFINVAMTIGLIPVTGTPLPLISYGGSFMVSVMSALGIAQSVYIRGGGIRKER